MKNPSQFFVVLGCLLVVAGVALRVIVLRNPMAIMVIRPISLIILANTSFLLAILLKK